MQNGGAGSGKKTASSRQSRNYSKDELIWLCQTAIKRYGRQKKDEGWCLGKRSAGHISFGVLGLISGYIEICRMKVFNVIPTANFALNTVNPARSLQHWPDSLPPRTLLFVHNISEEEFMSFYRIRLFVKHERSERHSNECGRLSGEWRVPSKARSHLRKSGRVYSRISGLIGNFSSAPADPEGTCPMPPDALHSGAGLFYQVINKGSARLNENHFNSFR